jgi:polysaccharide biosynthesis protein PslJ
MEVIEGSSGPRPAVPIAIVLSSLAVLTLSVVGGLPVKVTAPAVCIVVAIAITYRVALRWSSLVAVVIGVILLVPIRRYTLPVNLPFNLEPYRLIVMFVGVGWLLSLLVDPRVRARPTGFRGPLLLFALGAFGSIIANPALVNAVQSHVIKQLSYFASFLIVLCLIVSVVRTHEQVDTIVKVLVGCGAVVAFFALVQARTGYNVFDHLTRFLPFLRAGYFPETPLRGGRLRTYGSAQHAIELGAILVMLAPLCLYLARRTTQKRWLLIAGLLLLGALATLSRTGMLMILVVVVTFLILRPKQTRRLWPLLLPLLAAVHIAMPGTLGTFKEAFFPQGGLIKEQSSNPGYVGSGRLADLGPSLQKLSREPLLGQGFGTRITDGPGANAPILDDQWLSTLVETGIVGFAAWLWLFLRAIRRFGVAAKSDESDLGWLLVAITSGVAAFMIAMLTFDAFTFTQVTFVLFIQLALGQVLLNVKRGRELEAAA